MNLLLSHPGIDIDYGYRFDSRYTRGHAIDRSPLFISSEKGHVEIVKQLLCSNANPFEGETRDNYTLSCLGVSIINNQWELASIILDHMKLMDCHTDGWNNLISDILLTCGKRNLSFLKQLLESNIFCIDDSVSDLTN